MRKLLKIIILLVLVGLLVSVRMFESDLFYDPLLSFFKNNHLGRPLPELISSKLFLSIGFRFLLNSSISLAVLWVVFKNTEVVKISVALYVILFILLIGIFSVLLFSSESGSHMSLFYVRRFLIQPLFLLILLPAFYFQQRLFVKS